MREARKQEAAAEPEAEKKPVGSLLPDAPVKRCTDDSGEAIWCGATLGLGLGLGFGLGLGLGLVRTNPNP